MSAEYLLHTYERYRTSWEAQDWHRFRTTVHHAYEFSVHGRPVGGVAETIEWSRMLLAAFSDFHQDVRARYPSSQVLVVEAVACGTCNGTPLSTSLPPPQPGRRLHLPYVKLLRFEDGLIRDDRQYHDRATLREQLYR